MEQTKPDCRCTWIDLRDLSILPHGWVMIRREEHGLESFGIKYLGEGFDPLEKLAQLEAGLDALIEWVNTDSPIDGRQKWYAMPEHIQDRIAPCPYV